MQRSPHTGKRKMEIERPANSQQRSWALCFGPSKCASEAGETLMKARLIVTGENVRGFYFSASLFPYQCYPSQSPSNRKHIPSFHLHMSSIPTGEKEALFPKRMLSPTSPEDYVIWVANTSNNDIPPCLQNLFKKKLHINKIPNVVLNYSKKQCQLPSVVIYLDHLLYVYGLVPNNSTYIH